MIRPWLAGLVFRRGGRVAATALGVAVAVALVASIGSFLSATTSKMTSRAVAGIPVDWQVEAAPGANPARVLAQVRSQPGVTRALPVSFARTAQLAATTQGATQTTGAGRVLGLPNGYARAFPGELRLLSGSLNGPLLAQQTAANLRARPGDTVTIARSGRPPARVTIAGVVDLPAADSLFQQVGAPPGAQPQAPPDNVVLLPQSEFARVESGSGQTVTVQVHAAFSHRLPGSPTTAFDKVSGAARNLETRLAGSGLVGNNIGAALDKARQDALYAQLLFLFLGVPGAIIAGLVTASVASGGAERRRREAALLRARGATTRQLVRIASAEAALAGGAGVALGLVAALAIGAASFGTASFGAGTLSAVLWAVGSALGGLAIAAAAIVLPAWRDARSLTVAGQRRTVGRRTRAPWWARYGLDFVALGVAALVYWQASRNGYQLVLAPEGVPQVSVNWYALAAPVLGWIGAGLLIYRLADLALRSGRGAVARLLTPLAHGLSPTVAATMSRQRRLLARGLALVALTGAFAGSTAVFNSTYNQQATVDARLTNGSDVTVTESPGARVGPGEGARLARVAGVSSVEPLQHRFAYVGADLQDLYGVRPQTIGAAGKLQNSWFQGGTASALMKKLAARPDAVLVAADTVKDFQLQPGDLVRLRLQDSTTGKLKTVPFHYAGVAKEFPTAPRDSFLIANASYVARQTGNPAVGTFLLQTSGAGPHTVAQRVRQVVGTSAQVSDIQTQRKVVGSNLTAVELSGLTRVELAFALALAIAACGVTLALGFRERRRTFAIARALGAKRGQLGAFVWSETLFVTLGGLVLGTLLAAVMADMLIRVLTGVFDPAPDSASIPWGYLAGLLALTIGAGAVAAAGTIRRLVASTPEELRDL
jgi:putative ABC transport system permease protein